MKKDLTELKYKLLLILIEKYFYYSKDRLDLELTKLAEKHKKGKERKKQN